MLVKNAFAPLLAELSAAGAMAYETERTVAKIASLHDTSLL